MPKTAHPHKDLVEAAISFFLTGENYVCEAAQPVHSRASV